MILSRREAKQRREPVRLVALLDSYSPVCEDYRNLRTNLMYSMESSPKIVLITSAVPGEGKTTICANLGIVMAQAGKSTLVVDCELRHPMVHEIFSVRNFQGLTNLLVEEEDISDVIQEGPLTGLSIITSGPLPSNSVDLLCSERFARFLGEARGKFDYVLLDAPPVDSLFDSVVVAPHCDGTLLVIDAKSTRKVKVTHSVRTLESVGGKVIGTVMNNVKFRKKGYYNYGYGRYDY